jgi:hypothetical protein
VYTYILHIQIMYTIFFSAPASKAGSAAVRFVFYDYCVECLVLLSLHTDSRQFSLPRHTDKAKPAQLVAMQIQGTNLNSLVAYMFFSWKQALRAQVIYRHDFAGLCPCSQVCLV